MKLLRMLLAKFMSLDDVTEAEIVLGLGMLIFAIACYTESLIWWTLLACYIVISIFVGILEEYIENENNRAKKNHNYFLEQTRQYMKTVEKCDSFVKI